MHQTVEFVIRHGYAVLFFWVLAEQAALPLPSIPLLLACGALARDGRMNAAVVIALGVAASLMADNVWFYLGRHRGSTVLKFLCRIAIEPDSCVRRTENAFLRYGSRSLILAKFLPGLSVATGPLAGISGMSQVRFLMFDTLGALIWICTYTLAGYLLAGQLETVFGYMERTGSWMALLAGGLLGAWIAWKFIQRQRFLRKLRVARITVEELRKRLNAGEDLMILDLRSGLENGAGGIPGALRIPLEELLDKHQDIPRDREIVLFCS